MIGKRIPAVLLGLCCLSSLAMERPVMAAGNSAVKMLDNNDDDLPDEAKNDSPEVQAACTRISSLLQQKHYDEAERLLAQTSLTAPRSPALKRLYAYMYLIRNQPAAAVKVMEDLQKMGSLTSEDKVLAGTAYWRYGALSKAITSLREAVSLDQNNPATEETYIRCLLANKEWLPALTECNKGLARFKTAAAQKSFQLLRAQASVGQTRVENENLQVQDPASMSPGPTRIPGG